MPIFILIFVLMGVLSGIGYGGFMYYEDTQERLTIYAENQANEF